MFCSILARKKLLGQYIIANHKRKNQKGKKNYITTKNFCSFEDTTKKKTNHKLVSRILKQKENFYKLLRKNYTTQ